MIMHKSKFAPFPLTIKVLIKKRDWYLFPQGWAWVGGFAEVSYQHSAGEYDIWKEVHYPTYKGYAFSWLFLHVIFEIRKGKGNEMLVEKRELRIPDMSKNLN
ncbi:MAG TPA: hypothetical protein VD884_13370 [Ohtaekwangia sp.]|nr:hypothetical protein [Ohtaekwangia sp.]